MRDLAVRIEITVINVTEDANGHKLELFDSRNDVEPPALFEVRSWKNCAVR